MKTMPLSAISIANSMGVSRQWVSRVIKNVSVSRDELKRKHILDIQDHLQAEASRLKTKKLTQENFHEILNSPLNLELLSQRLYEPTNYIEKIINTEPEKRNPVSIAIIWDEVLHVCDMLERLIITDYIEHEEVARALQPYKGKFNGVEVK